MFDVAGNGATSAERIIAGVATVVFLTLGAWGLSSLTNAQERISVVETETRLSEKQLDRLEDKVDEILRRLTSQPRSSRPAPASREQEAP